MLELAYNMKGQLRPIVFVGSSRKDLKEMPDDVQADMGFALYQAQQGLKPSSAKVLKSFGGAGVLEVVENFDGDTYRAVYTVKLKKAVYVLHCFQKKSKKGTETPKQEMNLIRQRLKEAEQQDSAN